MNDNPLDKAQEQLIENIKELISSKYNPAPNMLHPAILKKPFEIQEEILQVLPEVDYSDIKQALEELGFRIDYDYGWMMLEK